MANTLTFANQTLTDANIFGGINYICDLNTGDEFSIGNTASACVSFVTDTQVPLYTKDQTNGVFEWTQDNTSRGTYYVTEVTKDNGPTYTVTAYDAMILLDTSITALSLTYPLTVATAAAAIATYIGCTTSGTIYNGTMAAADGTIDDTTTIRQLLSWVAEASGASVKIDAADHIVFLYYASSGITVTASDYKEYGLVVADYTCAAIDNVTICDMAGMTAATAGSGTNSLFIQGNPFLYDATSTEAATILGLVDSFVYAPFKCEMFEENGLDVGVTATFGTVTSLVMHLESSEDGVVASSVGSDSRAEFNKTVEMIANEALTTAQEAQQTADELNLHFWYTATGSEAGAHIAEVDKETFESNPSGGNLLSSSTGIKVRDGLDELATFGANGVRIGQDAGAHSVLDDDGMVIYAPDGETVLFSAGNGSTKTAVRDYRTFQENSLNYALSYVIDTTETLTVVSDDGTTIGVLAINNKKVTINSSTLPANTAYLVFTYVTEEVIWDYCISPTEPEYRAKYAVSENHGKAYGQDAHAENNSIAAGKNSHSQGEGTIALGDNQCVMGRYNDTKGYQVVSGGVHGYSQYPFVIGNGTSSARSNALTVAWDGNVEMALGTTEALYTAINSLGWTSDVIV